MPRPSAAAPPGRATPRSSARSAISARPSRSGTAGSSPVSIPGEEEHARRRDRRRLAPDEARGCRPAGEPARAATASSGTRSRHGVRSCSARPRSATSVRAQVGDRFSLDVTGAYSVIAIVGPGGRDRAAPADAPPPLPVGRRDRPRPGPRARARRRLLGRLPAGARAATSGRSRSTARRRSAAGPVGVDALRRRRAHEGHLPPQGDPQAARAAEAALRRRHRRRRLPRARDRVLPREPPRHHRRRDPREELHRLGRRGPQHDDHPSELPHPRGRRLLQGERQALREALGRPRLQHDVLAARPLHARPLRPLAGGAERACRGEQAARHRQPRDRPRRGQEALPADPHRRGRDLADPGCALPPAGRDHPPRRGRLGLRQAGRPARHRDPPGRRGDRVRRQGRQGARRQDEPGRHLDAASSLSATAGWSTPCRRARRRAAADHRLDPAGVRDRAREAVPRQDHRLGADAHLLSRRPTAASS